MVDLAHYRCMGIRARAGVSRWLALKWLKAWERPPTESWAGLPPGGLRSPGGWLVMVCLPVMFSDPAHVVPVAPQCVWSQAGLPPSAGNVHFGVSCLDNKSPRPQVRTVSDCAEEWSGEVVDLQAPG